MDQFNIATNRYLETSVNTSTPEQLVVMLYEAAIHSLKKAAVAVETRNLVSKRECINRALAIIQHLQGTLDMERGADIAESLDRLYTYVVSRITHGSMHLDPEPLIEAATLLSNVVASWYQLARKSEESSVAAAVSAEEPGRSARLVLRG